jgi:hypothetical protein
MLEIVCVMSFALFLEEKKISVTFRHMYVVKKMVQRSAELRAYIRILMQIFLTEAHEFS